MSYAIMIIDDEQMILDMLRDQFEMEQYQVITAKSGEEALQKLTQQPDIILLDINMPGMDGLELCRAIRDHVTCPILFLTARIEEADRVAGLRAGGDDYILKPFSLAELTARHNSRPSIPGILMSSRIISGCWVSFCRASSPLFAVMT